METKYGPYSGETLDSYRKRLISKTFKLLPFREENYPTLDEYIVSLIFEVKGFFSLIDKAVIGVELVSVLDSLRSEAEFSVYRKEVFRAISLIEKSGALV